MTERKDKKKVVGEAMTDEQVLAFLHGEPEAGVDRDFHLLLRAYRSLREEDFARFIKAFRDEGGNTEARDPHGRTLAEIISEHGKSQGYLRHL